ncbi:Uncharacterised protein [Candidatus Gugararchaeum adminiculabundum]|nr:Uncharacterised protein [Candidatus Gugararchaeum adminiculabundum]
MVRQLAAKPARTRRAFFTVFLLISLIALAALLTEFQLLKSKNYSQGITYSLALERKHYFELDVRRSISRTVESAAQEAVREAAASKNPYYSLLILEKLSARLPELESYYNSNNSADYDYDVLFWCSPSDYLGNTAEKMVEQKKALYCSNCVPISSPACSAAFYIDTLNKKISLKSGNHIGFSAYDKQSGLAFTSTLNPGQAVYDFG